MKKTVENITLKTLEAEIAVTALHASGVDNVCQPTKHFM
jgi:hypothetical protein